MMSKQHSVETHSLRSCKPGTFHIVTKYFYSNLSWSFNACICFIHVTDVSVTLCTGNNFFVITADSFVIYVSHQ